LAAHAFVTIPFLATTAHATGTMTLTQTGPFANALLNSVTLALTGPDEPGGGPFPATLNFVITSGTGAFAGATGTGRPSAAATAGYHPLIPVAGSRLEIPNEINGLVPRTGPFTLTIIHLDFGTGHFFAIVHGLGYRLLGGGTVSFG